MTERLAHWARTAPGRVWLADRGPELGEWRILTYGEAWEAVRRIGGALLALGLSPERPLLILSENDIDHALMAYGAQAVGIPSAAVSTAYSLLSRDYGRLREVVACITPGAVFAADGQAYAAAVEAALPPDVPLVVVRNRPSGLRREVIGIDELRARPLDAEAERAMAAVGPDTVAKFMFTSGTTGSPKAVITTQRMLVCNAAMVEDCYRFARETPPVLVDWAPWSHVAAGNKTMGFVLWTGGSYYIDRGKPTPQLIGETIRNIVEIRPNWLFNVPVGWEMLVKAMETDRRLREALYERTVMLMYAGAGMARHTYHRLHELAVETVGERVRVCSALGSTETAPFALAWTEDDPEPGNVGVPAKGLELKLVPHGDRLEARLRGPSITPGYWREPELTRRAFDEEGFYRLGDALRFVVPGDPSRGFRFDGRVAENFKLRTGTWVAVGEVRRVLVDALGGLVLDAVIAGEDRDELGALLVPSWPALRRLVPDGETLSETELALHPLVRAELARRLTAHARTATGSANRVVRALLLTEPLSFDRGEVTDKGSVNQRAVLRNRAELVERLYSDAPEVIRVPAG